MESRLYPPPDADQPPVPQREGVLRRSFAGTVMKSGFKAAGGRRSHVHERQSALWWSQAVFHLSFVGAATAWAAEGVVRLQLLSRTYHWLLCGTGSPEPLAVSQLVPRAARMSGW